MASQAMSPDVVISSRPFIPERVVSREFVHETVVLNLDTGIYHGLNPTGARMLETLRGAETVRIAAATLAELYDRPVAEIENDLAAFCLSLHDRGLLDLTPAVDAAGRSADPAL